MVKASLRLEQLQALASRLGITFTDYSLLDQALTHASAKSGREGEGADYESLEFVGDAVLGLAIADHLYRQAPGLDPGDYSRMRAGVVNRKSLAQVAERLGIAPAILLGKGEERAGGRLRIALLADCLESLIGAVYLELGWETVHRWILQTFAEELAQAQALERVWDFKSRLQHHCQARQEPLPVFAVVRSHGPDHSKEFEVSVSLEAGVSGHGTGRTKKEAEQNAAREALARLGLLPEE